MGLLYAALPADGLAQDPVRGADVPAAEASTLPPPSGTRDGQLVVPQWQRYYARCPSTMQARLRPLLLVASLARALKGNALDHVRGILRDCVDDDFRAVAGVENAAGIIARLTRVELPAMAPTAHPDRAAPITA